MPIDYIVTVKEVYTTGYEVPKGWELTGEFRPPKEGEKWLSLRGIAAGNKAQDVNESLRPMVDWIYDPRPRLILRRAKTKVITFRSTGDHRVPRLGEWYQPNPPDSPFYKNHNGTLFGSYPIFTRTETEE